MKLISIAAALAVCASAPVYAQGFRDMDALYPHEK